MKTEQEVRAAMAALLSEEWRLNDPAPPPPPDPPPAPADPRPVTVFTAGGLDDTAKLQQLLDGLGNDSILDIRGVAAINTRGLIMVNRRNTKVTSTNGGGLYAIGSGLYATPFSSLLYADGLNGCSFEQLKFSSGNHPATGLFLARSVGCKVLRCDAAGVAADPAGGAPWAGIYGERNTDTEVGYCTVSNLGNGVRGIWFGVGDRPDIRPHIHHNIVRGPGHSGIVTESSGPYVHHNSVFDVVRDGTGYKFIARGEPEEAVFIANEINNCYGGGFMIEGSGIFPRIIVHDWIAANIGRPGPGREFGLLYVSGGAGTRNVEVSGCKLTNCMKIAALNYASDFKFLNNVSDGGRAVISLESNCSKIEVVNSGEVEVGNQVSWVSVDGVRKA